MSRSRSGRLFDVRFSSRSLVGLAGVVALAVSLSACGSPSADPTPDPSTAMPSETASASETPSAAPSSAASITLAKDLSAITVTGDKGKKPTVKGPWPWGIEDTQVKVLSPGTGTVVPDSGQVQVNYIGINGRTGEPFDDSYERGAPAVFGVDQVIPGFKQGLVGQKVGSQVLIGIPSKDGYGEGGQPGAGIQGGDTLLFVVEIVNASLPGPTGEPVAPAAGLPTVADQGGTPKVTVPGGQPPAKLVAQPLIKGPGRKITAKDNVTVNYLAVDYETGEELVSTYGDKPQSGLLSDVIKGWQQGLEGQTLGSRVLLVVPPADAYPNGNTNPSIAPGRTLVYVIDLLFAETYDI